MMLESDTVLLKAKPFEVAVWITVFASENGYFLNGDLLETSAPITLGDGVCHFELENVVWDKTLVTLSINGMGITDAQSTVIAALWREMLLMFPVSGAPTADPAQPVPVSDTPQSNERLWPSLDPIPVEMVFPEVVGGVPKELEPLLNPLGQPNSTGKLALSIGARALESAERDAKAAQAAPPAMDAPTPKDNGQSKPTPQQTNQTRRRNALRKYLDSIDGKLPTLAALKVTLKVDSINTVRSDIRAVTGMTWEEYKNQTDRGINTIN